MIEIIDLKKKFGTTKALDGLNFTVRQGEILGFLGPNGAGKTTTMKIITGYWEASSGGIKLDGKELNTKSWNSRRRIGYLPENNPLYEDMKVFEYLKYVAEVRDVLPDKLLERIKEIAERCGLNKVMGQTIAQLSKGYRQRVGIAQAIMHNPDVLILDEPTTGLDPNQIIEIRELIREIGREKTVLFSTHILSEAAALCDRVLIINQGKIVAEGTPNELMAKVDRSEYRLVVAADKELVEAALLTLLSVMKVELVEVDGETVFVIEPKSANARQEIAALMLDKAWPILEFSRRQASLEDVFKQLTC